MIIRYSRLVSALVTSSEGLRSHCTCYFSSSRCHYEQPSVLHSQRVSNTIFLVERLIHSIYQKRFRFAFCITDQWMLIYWPGEDAVCIVTPSSLVSPSVEELRPGDKCRVKMGKSIYPGQFVDIGKNGIDSGQSITTRKCFQGKHCTFAIGGKRELTAMEEKFLRNECTIDDLLSCGSRNGHTSNDSKERKQLQDHNKGKKT